MTVYAYVTGAMTVRATFAVVADYDCVCPCCFYDNNIDIACDLLTGKISDVGPVTCICRRQVEPKLTPGAEEEYERLKALVGAER